MEMFAQICRRFPSLAVFGEELIQEVDATCPELRASRLTGTIHEGTIVQIHGQPPPAMSVGQAIVDVQTLKETADPINLVGEIAQLVSRNGRLFLVNLTGPVVQTAEFVEQYFNSVTIHRCLPSEFFGNSTANDEHAIEFAMGMNLVDLFADGRIGVSSVHGFGLFANSEIAKHAQLFPLDGQIVSLDKLPLDRIACPEWNALPGRRLLLRVYSTKYGFINHSREPNVAIEDGHVVALREIATDQEILIDYRRESLPIEYTSSPRASYL